MKEIALYIGLFVFCGLIIGCMQQSSQQDSQQSPSTSQVNSIPVERQCRTDSDCACGVRITTGGCFYGNQQYVNELEQCPDFCTGIAGNLVIKCIDAECKQVNAMQVTTMTLKPTTTEAQTTTTEEQTTTEAQTTTNAQATTTVLQATTTTLPAAVTVVIKDFAFRPDTVTIKAGTTVTWINQDDAPHKVASNPHPAHTDLPGLVSGTLSKGDSYSFTFTETGTFGYHCHLHPSMLGTIIVEA